MDKLTLTRQKVMIQFALGGIGKELEFQNIDSDFYRRKWFSIDSNALWDRDSERVKKRKRL